MAGAVQGFRSNPPSGTDGAASTRTNAKPIGAVALTIPVASNRINSSVAAYLDSQLAEADGVRIVGESNTDVQAVVVGAAFAVRTANVAPAGKLNLAGAGAVGVNTVSQNVAAFIKDSDINSDGDVTVDVFDRSAVESDAGGVAIAASKNPQTRAALSFGVSVAINDIVGTVMASVDNSVVRLTDGNLLINAQSESDAEALSIAGGVSANFGAGQSGSFGGAGAHAENSIEKTIAANLRGGSVVTVDAGAVSVTASDASEITADAGGVGIGITGGSGGSIAGAVGISMAFNDIANQLHAVIDSSTVTAADPTTVTATMDQAKISALTIAASAGLAGSSGFAAALAGAGAGSGNTIGNSVVAAIDNSAVTSSFTRTDDRSDGVIVSASDSSEILATSVGASLSSAISSTTGGSVAVGISISNNDIANETRASVTGSTLDVASDIRVQANQTAIITATSVAASVAVAGGNVGVGVSGAGASANNSISNQTIATVDGSVLQSAGDIVVTATDDANMTATIVAATVSLAGGSTGVAAAFGFSSATNRFGDATTFLDDPGRGAWRPFGAGQGRSSAAARWTQ